MPRKNQFAFQPAGVFCGGSGILTLCFCMTCSIARMVAKSGLKFPGRNPNLEKKIKIKNGLIFFLWLEADFLGALKPSPRYHYTFVKVGFLDKVTEPLRYKYPTKSTKDLL